MLLLTFYFATALGYITVYAGRGAPYERSRSPRRGETFPVSAQPLSSSLDTPETEPSEADAHDTLHPESLTRISHPKYIFRTRELTHSTLRRAGQLSGGASCVHVSSSATPTGCSCAQHMHVLYHTPQPHPTDRRHLRAELGENSPRGARVRPRAKALLPRAGVHVVSTRSPDPSSHGLRTAAPCRMTALASSRLTTGLRRGSWRRRRRAG